MENFRGLEGTVPGAGFTEKRGGESRKVNPF